MHAKGVTCSDCHDPHSGKLRADGSAVCSACHLASKYDTPEHHHHSRSGGTVTCVSCHMPPTTYMVVDPRHDHSLRIPRPDLSVALATANACNGCHTNRDPQWASAAVTMWYGHEPQGYQRFAGAFSAAQTGRADGPRQLRSTVADVTQPPIVRATALAQLDASSDVAALETVAQGLRDPSAVVRLGALQSLATAPIQARVAMAAPSLADQSKAVRIAAVSLLQSVPTSELSAQARAAFERSAGEYVETQRYNADRAEGRVSLGTFYGSRGDAGKGEHELKAAIRLDPFFIPAYVNLADLYRAFGRDLDGERVLRQGLTVAPKSGALHYALGLALVRLKRSAEALDELERASVLDAGSARFAYAYGVALHSAGKTDAAKATLQRALAAHPDAADVRAALASFTNGRRD
jgi:Tfp pilus assembly protein PilF